ncbi:PIN domain-containing protein [Cryobacterium levicorallinum]|uniref:PIN domain-containing protein n=1 Tax=Cryobacterium levicorallinum TaxID=995038 RepID=UPI0035A25EC3
MWARLGTSPSLVAALRKVVELHSPASIWVCAPTAIEIGFSARNGPEHDSAWTPLSAFSDCPRAPTIDESLVIQNRLWHAALVRSVGEVDTLIAAYALINDATVLHYDSDFEYVARVMPRFRHEWIVPRGTV